MDIECHTPERGLVHARHPPDAGVGAGFGTLIDRGEAPNLSVIFEWRILLPLLGLAALSLLPVLYTRLRGGKAAS